MNKINRSITVLSITAALTLAACGSGGPDDPTAANTPLAATAVITPKPLTAAQVNVDLKLQGKPTVSTDGASVNVVVNLANHGTVTLASTGPNPINLGAHSVNSDGSIDNNDLTRAALPNIAPNSQATVTIHLPLDEVIGKSALILPVQEGAGWFDKWGTKPVSVGPFQACGNASAGKVCHPDGTPLKIDAAQ